MKRRYVFQWNPRKIYILSIPKSQSSVPTGLSKFITCTEMNLQQLTQSRLGDLNAVIKLVFTAAYSTVA